MPGTARRPAKPTQRGGTRARARDSLRECVRQLDALAAEVHSLDPDETGLRIRLIAAYLRGATSGGEPGRSVEQLAKLVRNLETVAAQFEKAQAAEDEDDYRASLEAEAEAREKGSRPWEEVKAELGI
ncbi:MAG: hypothetical protein L0216_01575 [Planctomycetales bacterium]|nr:hypothetical protein [Planctomycetales bacterium]